MTNDTQKQSTSEELRKILDSWGMATESEAGLITQIARWHEQKLAEERERVLDEIFKHVEESHEHAESALDGKKFYDSYSDDYKHGILRGITLIGRLLDSLKTTKLNKAKEELAIEQDDINNQTHEK